MSSLPESTPDTAAIAMESVSFRREQRSILSDIDWTVRAGERWVVLGANGCGKTTLIRLAALYDHPSSGRLVVLGSELGRCDVRALRRRVGFVSAAFVDLIRPDLIAADVVMCALNASLEPWWHTYGPADRDAARQALDTLGIAYLAERRFGSLSSGERQRVQLARTLMTDPELLLFDEPTAGLDLAGRETFVDDLDRLGTERPMALVTHHVEEIPSSFTHALMLRSGRVVASGPIEDTLDSASLSAVAGIEVSVERSDGRWIARRSRGQV